MDQLPQNPAMLLSVVNTWLRDRYNGSLQALCDDMNIDIDELLEHMKKAGWEYSADTHRFW